MAQEKVLARAVIHKVITKKDLMKTNEFWIEVIENMLYELRIKEKNEINFVKDFLKLKNELVQQIGSELIEAMVKNNDGIIIKKPELVKILEKFGYKDKPPF